MGDSVDNLAVNLLNSLLEPAVRNFIISELERTPNNAGKVKFAEQLVNEEIFVPASDNPRRPKSNQLAKQYREQGNKYFSTWRFADALKCYNKSLCFAENNSENVGLAYANRSAVYCELKLYSRALSNIEKALEHNYPQKSIDKLKEREEKCKQKLEEGEIEPSDVPNGVEFFKLSHEPNPQLPFIADCLKLESSEQFGRHIITEKNLMPGDIVAIEEPFSKCLKLKNCNYSHCANCLSDNWFDLLACTECTATMFCSESCRGAAFKTFHEYECPVVDQLEDAQRHATRTVLEALALYSGNIKNLMAATKHAQNVTVFDFDLSNNDDEQSKRINLWKAVNSLATNESLREKTDLLMCYYETASATCRFFKSTKLGDLLKTKRSKDIFRELLLKQVLILRINLNNIRARNLASMKNELCGTGLYPFCALINHSCAPNIKSLSYNSNQCLVVCRPIKAGDQLFVSYGYNHHLVKDCITRKAELARIYMFRCSCEACETHYPLQPGKKTGTPSFKADSQKLKAMDVETARKRFGENCTMLNVFDQHYPCYEFSIVQGLFELCLLVLKRSPAQISVMKQN